MYNFSAVETFLVFELPWIHTKGNVGSMRRVKTITMPFLLFMRMCRGFVS